MTKKQLLEALAPFDDNAEILINRDLAGDPLGATRSVAEVIDPGSMVNRDIVCHQRENVLQMVADGTKAAFLIMGPGNDYTRVETVDIEPTSTKEVKNGKAKEAS